MVKIIETRYNGRHFRSRTEARWAVLFDEIGIKYEYEAEGYKLDDGTYYLPDFWLPTYRAFVEVKGNHPTKKEWSKLTGLMSSNGPAKVGVFLVGQPSIQQMHNPSGICVMDGKIVDFNGAAITKYAHDKWENFLYGSPEYYEGAIEADKEAVAVALSARF